MKLVKSFSNYAYIRVSLIVWRINGLSRIQNLDMNAGQKMAELLDVISEGTPIVIDFKKLVTITDGALSKFMKAVIDAEIEVHFINSNSVKQTIRNLFDEFNPNGDCQLIDRGDKITLQNENIQIDKSNEDFNIEIASELNKWIQQLVRKCFVPNDEDKLEYQPLLSTPIMATGQYDASKITSDPDSFTWVCVRMADLVDEVVAENTILNTEILSVSLKSSPFANAISTLLDIEMRTIDHLGPFQKVWDFHALSQSGRKRRNYIFIGDFIVCGTEMKLAHLFAKYGDSDLKHAVAIGSVLEADRFPRYRVKFITSLKDLNRKSKYKLF